MKIYIVLFTLLFMASCSREVPFKEPVAKDVCKKEILLDPSEKSTSSGAEIRILDWGPQTTTFGVNPNRQPGGELGIWIKINSTSKLGEVDVLLDGKPALVSTVVDENLITAAVSAEFLLISGKKEVNILQKNTKKIFPVGFFEVSKK